MLYPIAELHQGYTYICQYLQIVKQEAREKAQGAVRARLRDHVPCTLDGRKHEVARLELHNESRNLGVSAQQKGGQC